MVIILGGIVAFSLVARNDRDDASQDTRKQVVTSFYPLYELTKQIAGERIRVSNATPAGVEPHDFEPSPKLLADLSKSDSFIYLNETFQPWASSFALEYRLPGIQAGIGLEPPQTDDPHVWIDPEYARQMARRIAEELARIDEANRSTYMANLQTYEAELQQLDEDFRSGLAQCKTRTIVTAHDAFGYLGKRYNLDVRSIAGLDPESEPDTTTLAELSRLVRENGITTVFYERLISPKLAETLANEVGAVTAVLDPIEGITDEDQAKGTNYLTLQRENLAAIRSALACQ